MRASQVLLVAAFVGAWQIVTVNAWIDPVLARTPGETWSYLVEATRAGELQSNTVATLTAVVLAWVLSAAVGVPAGLALGLMPRVDAAVSPLLEAISAMPRIALAPVFIVYFGIDTSAKVALAFTLGFFIVVSGTQAGVRSIENEYVRLATILGARKTQVLGLVYLPGAVPAVFAALRLSLIYSLLGVVGSEIIASRDGLGKLISTYSGLFRMDAVYGILILLAVVATIINRLTALVERRLVSWQAPTESR